MSSRLRQVVQPSLRALRYRLARPFFSASLMNWPTKSYEVWLFLQFVLYETQPRTVLEIGSGRSTHYFSEYCQKMGADFVSIEENNRYVRQTQIGLVHSFLRPDGMHTAPIRGDWYDTQVVHDATRGRSCDFILVDGPIGHGQSTRNSSEGNRILRALSADCSVVVFDDFDWTDVQRSAAQVLEGRLDRYSAFLLSYPMLEKQQQILFMVDREHEAPCEAFLELCGLESHRLPFEMH